MTNPIEQMPKVDILEILTRIPKGHIGITDPMWVFRRRAEAQPKVEAICQLLWDEGYRKVPSVEEIQDWLLEPFNEPQKHTPTELTEIIHRWLMERES